MRRKAPGPGATPESVAAWERDLTDHLLAIDPILWSEQDRLFVAGLSFNQADGCCD